MPHHDHLMIARVEAEDPEHAAARDRQANEPGRDHDDRAGEPRAPFRQADAPLRHIEVPGRVAPVGDNDDGPGPFAHDTLIWSPQPSLVVTPRATGREL